MSESVKREIKFRVWDSTHKEYREVKEIYFNTDGDAGVVFDGGCGFDYCDIIEQYTGLKDKNGKESYFNDNFRMCESGNVYTIIFKYGAFGYISKMSGDFVTLHHLKNVGLEWEIIGNIHEEKS